jgi:hypothetical protein
MVGRAANQVKHTTRWERRRPRRSSSAGGVAVILVYAMRDARPAVARHLDDRPIDAGVRVTAALVVGEEGV